MAGILDGIGNQYVVFGYKSVEKTVIRLGSFKDPNIAKQEAIANYGDIGMRLHHVGIAKVQHPQKIWFYKLGSGFIPVPNALTLDILTLVGV
jgi:hypothetical protein